MKNTAHHTHLLLLAAVLVIAGLPLRYWIGKRRFYRRFLAGLQQFSSYKKAIVLTILEKLLAYLAYLLITAGLLLYVIA